MNPIPRVRWLTNVVLTVILKGGSTRDDTFKSGHYTQVNKVRTYTDGFADLHLPSGDIIEGVKWGEALEIHGEVVIEKADEESEEIVEEEIVEDEKSSRKWPTSW